MAVKKRKAITRPTAGEYAEAKAGTSVVMITPKSNISKKIRRGFTVTGSDAVYILRSSTSG